MTSTAASARDATAGIDRPQPVSDDRRLCGDANSRAAIRSNSNLECASGRQKELAKQIKCALEGGLAGERKVVLGVQRLEPSTRYR